MFKTNNYIGDYTSKKEKDKDMDKQVIVRDIKREVGNWNGGVRIHHRRKEKAISCSGCSRATDE